MGGREGSGNIGDQGHEERKHSGDSDGRETGGRTRVTTQQNTEQITAN